MSAPSSADERFMRLALELAERGRGKTHPNPVVGAVVVKNGRVIARGFHQRAGGPHAEIEALAQLGFRARGATLYVTLEPCCHRGRTGPCTAPIIEAGVTRVVIGCRDRNPLVSGRGIRRLRGAGLRVDVGCLEAESHAKNRAFFRWIADQRPFVTLKLATTLDGFIAPPPKGRRSGVHWITGAPARQVAHELRAEHDALLVGVGTILADDPRLTVRLPRAHRHAATHPRRVILDTQLRIPPKSAIFRSALGPAPLVFAAKPKGIRPALRKRALALASAGADVVFLPAGADGRPPIDAVLRELARRNVQSLLVEGGSEVAGAFIAARLVDAAAFFLAPTLVGGGVAAVRGPGLDWKSPLKLGHTTLRVVGDDILVRADVLSPPHRD